jgi:hypothetical protein
MGVKNTKPWYVRDGTIVRNTMITTVRRLRRRGVQIAIALEERPFVRAVYIRVIERRSTTSAATEQGGLKMLELALLIAQQIAQGSLPGIN